ncbi:MAG: hypothetical protein WC285_02865, partial [Candidatus Gracilibacteria bacterium]
FSGVKLYIFYYFGIPRKVSSAGFFTFPGRLYSSRNKPKINDLEWRKLDNYCTIKLDILAYRRAKTRLRVSKNIA